jgi:crotonobetainyl-CoA:carnitine CoA-transferase CaiB-like acyl-CoA transferase
VQRTTREWAQFGIAENIPMAAVNDAASIVSDPHFQTRMPWQRTAEDGPDLLPLPVRFGDGELPAGRTAPGYGEHTESVLSGVLGYDAERIARLRELGVLGEAAPGNEAAAGDKDGAE